MGSKVIKQAIHKMTKGQIKISSFMKNCDNCKTATTKTQKTKIISRFCVVITALHFFPLSSSFLNFILFYFVNQ